MSVSPTLLACNRAAAESLHGRKWTKNFLAVCNRFMGLALPQYHPFHLFSSCCAASSFQTKSRVRRRRESFRWKCPPLSLEALLPRRHLICVCLRARVVSEFRPSSRKWPNETARSRKELVHQNKGKEDMTLGGRNLALGRIVFEAF